MFPKWCEALSSISSALGGPSGWKPRVQQIVYVSPFSLNLDIQIIRVIETTFNIILEGQTYFTGMALNNEFDY